MEQRKRATLSKDKILGIVAMRAQGMTDKQIADALGCHRVTINYWVRRLRQAGHEVKRFPRGGRKPLEL